MWAGVSTVYFEIRLSTDRTSDWISRAASMRVLAIVAEEAFGVVRVVSEEGEK